MAFLEYLLCARPEPSIGMQDDGSIGLALKELTSNVGGKDTVTICLFDKFKEGMKRLQQGP